MPAIHRSRPVVPFNDRLKFDTILMNQSTDQFVDKKPVNNWRTGCCFPLCWEIMPILAFTYKWCRVLFYRNSLSYSQETSLDTVLSVLSCWEMLLLSGLLVPIQLPYLKAFVVDSKLGMGMGRYPVQFPMLDGFLFIKRRITEIHNRRPDISESCSVPPGFGYCSIQDTQ